MTTTNLITTRLNKRGGNALVLAKVTKYGTDANGYANLTQAENAAAKLRAQGVNCEVIGRRPFYVRIAE